MDVNHYDLCLSDVANVVNIPPSNENEISMPIARLNDLSDFKLRPGRSRSTL